MKSPIIPITDDHIHIDPVNGRGLDAAKDFLRAGGSHLFLVTKPSSSFGIRPRTGREYVKVFEETIAVADQIRALGINVFVVLGIHPAEITRISAELPLNEAVAAMKKGLDIAASYISDGRAIALKSGRPHYPVPDDVLSASNDVLSHALVLAAEEAEGVGIAVHDADDVDERENQAKSDADEDGRQCRRKQDFP